tara:strand:+ start:34401 stop:35021 length:621 start_codon:yes stop_codon:yes gene_type:complete
MEKISILPPNLSDLERALDVAIARIEDVNIPISTLWDPWACPIDVLPYLAWALSVDFWRSDWSEAVKRKVVANAKLIHSKKGTRQAVERAIAGVFGSSEIKEWFEFEPRKTPGTFVVNAIVGDDGINSRTISDLTIAIDNAKRKSAHYTLRVTLSADGLHQIALAGLSAPLIVVEPYSIRELMSEGLTLVAAGIIAAQITTVEAIE